MKSLKARLGLGLALSLVTLFTIQWFAVTSYMRGVVEDYAASRLSHDMDNLLAGLSFSPEGAPVIRRESVDPMYQRPFSGHYYIVTAEPSEPLRSRSLWDFEMETARAEPGSFKIARVKGPSGQTILSLSGGFVKNGRKISITMGENVSVIESEISRFKWRYAAGSFTAMIALIILQWLIVRKGLAPLNRARDDIARLERGETDSITEDIPTEALPLVREINRLLGALRDRLRRSRESAGNMAHALKTPLASLMGILETNRAALGPSSTDSMESSITAIRERIERELNRARLAGANAPGKLFNMEKDAPDLISTLEKIYREKDLSLTWEAEPGVNTPMEREDALELIGTLLDNACKWASRRVALTSRETQGLVEITIEDDGPGLSEGDIAKIAKRGVRLDESLSGHGLGLAIAVDIVEGYSGEIDFGRSVRLGGFMATVKLPKAAGA